MYLQKALLSKIYFLLSVGTISADGDTRKGF